MTAGIGEAIKRSAASFQAANTSIEEAVAIVTTANSVAQDPASIGTAMKTMSARIRASKVELEELGEAEDGVIESTASLQKYIKKITGFDILEKDGKTFKSLYEILLGVGEEFQKLDDVTKAALTEKMFGKRMGNIGLAILNDTEQLQKVYATAMDATGSAQREQENYARSVQYSIDQLKAAAQELANDVVNSQFLKGSIDVFTKLVNIVDELIKKFGVLGPLIGGLRIAADVTSIGPQNIARSFGALLSGDLQSQEVGIANGKIIKKSLAEAIIKSKSSGVGLDTLKNAYSLTDNDVTSGLNLIANNANVTTKSINAASAAVGLLKGTIGSIAVTAAVVGVTKLVTAINKINDGARETSESLSRTSQNIDDYRDRVIKLRQVMSNSSSSFEEVQAAQQELFGVQKDLIDQYGSHAGMLDILGTSVDTLRRKFEDLKKAEYDSIIEDYNNKYSDVFSRIALGKQTPVEYAKSRYEQGGSSFIFTSDKLLSAPKEFQELILGLDNVEEYGGSYAVNGNLQETYDTLLKIGEYAKTYKVGDDIISGIAKETERAKGLLEDYSEIYNASVFVKDIYPNNAALKRIEEIESAGRNYAEAIAKGNEEAIEQTADKLVYLLDPETMDGLSDEAKQWIVNNMVPELQGVLDKHRLKIRFEANENGITDEVLRYLGVFRTGEEAKGYTVGAIADEGQFRSQRSAQDRARTELSRIATDYGLDYNGLIDLAMDQGLIPSNIDERFKEELDRLADTPAFDKLEKKSKDWTSAYKRNVIDIVRNSKTAEEALKKLSELDIGTSSGSVIDKFADMTNGMDQISDVLADMQNGDGKFDFTKIGNNKFAKAFEGVDSKAIEDFQQAVLASKGDWSQDAQDAANALADAYIRLQLTGEGLTEMDHDVVASMLETMNVTNSEEYATQLLNDALVDQIQSKTDAAIASGEAGDAAFESAEAMYDEAIAGNENNVAYQNLRIAKLQAAITIGSDKQIARLAQEAEAVLGTADAWMALAEAKSGSQAFFDKVNSNSALDDKEKNMLIEGRKKSIKLKEDKVLKQLEEAKGKSTAAVAPTIAGSPGSSGSGGGGGGGDKSAKQKQLEWLERYINKAADARDEVQKMVDDERTLYDIRIAYNDDLIKAQDEYIRRLDEARILMESEAATLEDQIREKLPDIAETIITKVANGDVTKEGWKDEFEGLDEEAEKLIDNYIDYTDKAKEYTDKVFDEEKTKLDQIQHEFELRINQIKAEMQALENEQEILQHSIDMRETTGSDIIKESDYEELIENADKLAENYYRQLDVLQEQKATLDEGSQAWYDVVSQIYECESAIRDVSKQQAEWNETIKQLPIRRIQRYIQMLQNIKKDIENFNAEQSTLGISTNKQSYVDMFDLDVKQLNKYEQELAKLRDNLKTYTYGTDKFEETANAIQECEDSVSGLIQEMHDYNTAILNIPIDKINEVVEKLEAIKDALSEVQEDNNLAIESAITLLSDQIDKYNEKISDTEKLYQDRIDALQEEEELNSKQLATEKARLQLEKMRGQLTNKVLKNGQWNWAADDSALKDAANNLRDAERQAEIDALEKERDAIIKPWQDEVEKLEKFQNKWEKLRPDRENELNFEKATDIFGDNNWRNKVLTGNDDDLWNKMDQSYNKYMRSIDAYNEQIKDYQQTTAIMSTYIAEYNKGNLTAAEVTAKMNKLIQNAAGGYQSMENLSDTLSAFNEASEDSALRNSTVTVNALYKDFGSYMDIVRDQNEILGQYTQTWDQIHTSVQEQLAELKRLAEIEEQKLKERQAARRERESSDRDSGGGSRTSNIIAVADSHGHVTSGTYDELREQGYVHHSGVLTGYIGAKSKDEKLRALETMSTMDMKRDEVPALLQEGEVVLNKDQQDQLLRNLVPLDDSDMLSRFTLGKDVLNLNAFRAKRLRGGNYVGAGVQMQQTFQFGDINIAEAQNVTDIAHGIMSGGLSQALTQQLYKR